MKLSFQSLGRAILFLTALGILVYEFIVGPHNGERPDSTIVIAAIVTDSAPKCAWSLSCSNICMNLVVCRDRPHT